MYLSIRSPATALLALGCLSSAASAHHPGGVGNGNDAGPITTISASTLEAGHGVAGIVLDQTSFNTVADGKLVAATATGNTGVHGLKSIQAYALGAAYGLTNDLTIAARLPFVRRTGIRAAEDDGSGAIDVLDHGGSAGFGDLTALGQWRFLNDTANRVELALLGGVVAPTGVTNRTSRQGELLDAEFQPGTGAWSGLVGFAATKRFGKWSADANVLYVRAGTGTQHTNLGDQALFNAAVSYRITGLGSGASRGPMYHGAVPHDPPPSGANLDLVLELNGEWHDKQRVFGAADQNSGGTTVFLSPGVRLSQDKLSGFLQLGVPVLNSTNGIQPEPNWRVRSGLAIGF